MEDFLFFLVEFYLKCQIQFTLEDKSLQSWLRDILSIEIPYKVHSDVSFPEWPWL